jgi:protein-S-isoprenylcysteine O-methyltransferase Ste14
MWCVETFHDLFIPTLWIVWAIYWFAAARNVKATVRREPFHARVIYWSLLIVGATLFTIVPSGDPLLWHQIYPQSAMTFWMGATLMVIGFAITVWARTTLGRNWSSTVTQKQDHELIQTGPYALVRHPIYTGLLVMFLGSGASIGQWRAVLALALVLASFLFKLRIEEQYMVELFGPTYEAYRKRVAMLIPWVW